MEGEWGQNFFHGSYLWLPRHGGQEWLDLHPGRSKVSPSVHWEVIKWPEHRCGSQESPWSNTISCITSSKSSWRGLILRSAKHQLLLLTSLGTVHAQHLGKPAPQGHRSQWPYSHVASLEPEFAPSASLPQFPHLKWGQRPLLTPAFAWAQEEQVNERLKNTLKLLENYWPPAQW